MSLGIRGWRREGLGRCEVGGVGFDMMRQS